MPELDWQSARHMWQRVLLQALRDALSNPPKAGPAELLARREAQLWLDGRTQDFEHVCSLAGFSADVVRDCWTKIKADREKMDAATLKFREAATRHGYSTGRPPANGRPRLG
jgi:hypothetical protein